MDRWKRIVVIGLLALWAPATVHCLLETLLPTAVLACDDHHTNRPHQGTDCQDDACGVVESADYCLGGREVFVHPPRTRALEVTSPAIERWLAPQPPIAGQPAFGRAGPPPPRLLVASVHFLQRAAPSPRAPSCLV